MEFFIGHIGCQFRETFKKVDSFNRTVLRNTKSCAQEPYKIENGDWYIKDNCNFKQTHEPKCLINALLETL